MKMTYIGGPTALLEFAGVRVLTDPTFDPAGSEYRTPRYTLRKTAGPALGAGSVLPLAGVLLSHDHHFDNLDQAGRALVSRSERVFTTPEGAARLGAPALGLAPWQTSELTGPEGQVVRVTGTPARHGPEGGDRGPVTGFVLTTEDTPAACVYVSGDTVWFDGVVEVARRFPVRVALLFMGAARVPEVGPQHLTFTAHEGAEAARAFGDATVIPLHFEGWAHYSESGAQIASAFAAAGLRHRLRLPAPGEVFEFDD